MGIDYLLIYLIHLILFVVCYFFFKCLIKTDHFEWTAAKYALMRSYFVPKENKQNGLILIKFQYVTIINKYERFGVEITPEKRQNNLSKSCQCGVVKISVSNRFSDAYLFTNVFACNRYKSYSLRLVMDMVSKIRIK